MTSPNLKTLVVAAGLAATTAFAASGAAAGGLKPGNYNVAGIQSICLVSDGTWYGETFSGWGGKWFAGPVKEDSFVLQGNYSSGAGNDSMTVHGSDLDWSEWQDDGSFNNFLDNTITKIKGACSPPAARANLHKNPMD